ncbi:MAG: hypothetical protein AB7F19_01830 [Candidatus Babeliales bacterium]
MYKKKYFILLALVFPQYLSAMNATKNYSATIENPGTALIVIHALHTSQEKAYIKVQTWPHDTIEIHAEVNTADIELQERYYAEVIFYPWLQDQTQETITIRPTVPGNYTIYVPKGSLLQTLKGPAIFEISAALRKARSCSNLNK